MKIKYVKFKDKDAAIIYVTKKEEANKAIQKEIENYKSRYKDVAIFISGEDKIEKALTEIIQQKI